MNVATSEIGLWKHCSTFGLTLEVTKTTRRQTQRPYSPIVDIVQPRYDQRLAGRSSTSHQRSQVARGLGQCCQLGMPTRCVRSHDSWQGEHASLALTLQPWGPPDHPRLDNPRSKLHMNNLTSRRRRRRVLYLPDTSAATAEVNRNAAKSAAKRALSHMRQASFRLRICGLTVRRGEDTYRTMAKRLIIIRSVAVSHRAQVLH